jgi:hypothetical protein
MPKPTASQLAAIAEADGQARPSGLDALAELRRTHPRLFDELRAYGAANRTGEPTAGLDAAERIAEYVLALAAGLTPA